MNILEQPEDDVDVGLEDYRAEENDRPRYIVLVVQLEAEIVTEYERGLDDEHDAEECDEDVDDVKHQEPLLQEDPGEDDDPDGGAGTDHVHVRHGHVLQTETWRIGKYPVTLGQFNVDILPVEEDDEVACPHDRSCDQKPSFSTRKGILIPINDN